MSIITQPPGHPDAIAQGCLCPAIDNGHGKGSGRVDQNGDPLYWLNWDCPAHVEQAEAKAEVDCALINAGVEL